MQVFEIPHRLPAILTVNRCLIAVGQMFLHLFCGILHLVNLVYRSGKRMKRQKRQLTGTAKRSPGSRQHRCLCQIKNRRLNRGACTDFSCGRVMRRRARSERILMLRAFIMRGKHLDHILQRNGGFRFECIRKPHCIHIPGLIQQNFHCIFLAQYIVRRSIRIRILISQGKIKITVIALHSRFIPVHFNCMGDQIL